MKGIYLSISTGCSEEIPEVLQRRFPSGYFFEDIYKQIFSGSLLRVYDGTKYLGLKSAALDFVFKSGLNFSRKFHLVSPILIKLLSDSLD